MHMVEKLLEEWVYPKLDRAEVLKDLNPKDDESRFILTCPKCNMRTARIHKTGVVLYCECGYFSDILGYTKERCKLNDYEAVKELAHIANCTEVFELIPQAN
jgi:hypothetical protein